jgi:hypothetical protein
MFVHRRVLSHGLHVSQSLSCNKGWGARSNINALFHERLCRALYGQRVHIPQHQGAQWNETQYKKGTRPGTERSSVITGQISMKKSSFKSLCSNGASLLIHCYSTSSSPIYLKTAQNQNHFSRGNEECTELSIAWLLLVVFL